MFHWRMLDSGSPFYVLLSKKDECNSGFSCLLLDMFDMFADRLPMDQKKNSSSAGLEPMNTELSHLLAPLVTGSPHPSRVMPPDPGPKHASRRAWSAAFSWRVDSKEIPWQAATLPLDTFTSQVPSQPSQPPARLDKRLSRGSFKGNPPFSGITPVWRQTQTNLQTPKHPYLLSPASSVTPPAPAVCSARWT